MFAPVGILRNFAILLIGALLCTLPLLGVPDPIIASSLYYAFSVIEAETGLHSEGISPVQSDFKTTSLQGFKTDEWIGFERIFFENSGAHAFEARLRTPEGGTFAVHIGGPYGPKIGSVEIQPAEDWQTIYGTIWRVTGLQPVF